MKIGALNIGRGYFKKFPSIEHILIMNDLTALFLTETDLRQDDEPIPVTGYDVLMCEAKKKRKLVVYIKSCMEAKYIESKTDLPSLHIETKRLSLCALYNEFSDTAPISQKTRLERVLHTVEEFATNSKNNAII